MSAIPAKSPHPLLAVRMDPRAKAVRIDDERLTVFLQDGRAISQPLEWTPGLVGATAQQRACYGITDDGGLVFWDDLDEDVCVGLMLNPRIDP